MRQIFAIALSCIMSFSSFAGNNQNILYYVDGLYTNSENIKSKIMQDVTNASNSCGPTSLLFVNNHFSVKQTGIKAGFTSSTSAAISELQSMYAYINEGYNAETSLNQLKIIAQYDWGWDNVRRRSASDGVDTNVDKLITDLANNRPGLVVLDSNFSGNPTRNTVSIDHIVIVYAYQKRRDDNGYGASSPYNNHQNDRIYFYDPYFGGNGYFTRGEIATAIDLTGFAYLQLAP